MAPLDEPDVVWAYRTYFPLLRRKCSRMLSDPAEAQDVAQETFTRLWRSRRNLRDQAAVAGWLYTTSTRLAVDRMRARGRLADEAEVADGGSGPEHIVGARAALERVARSLSADDLQILVLWRIDGLEQAEIAELMGIGERTVRRRLRDAERRLARLGVRDV